MIYLYLAFAFITRALPYAAAIGATVALLAGLVHLGSRLPVHRRRIR